MGETQKPPERPREKDLIQEPLEKVYRSGSNNTGFGRGQPSMLGWTHHTRIISGMPTKASRTNHF